MGVIDRALALFSIAGLLIVLGMLAWAGYTLLEALT